MKVVKEADASLPAFCSASDDDRATRCFGYDEGGARQFSI
jgi:hypothetical protein